MIEVTNLSKHYGTNKAVDNISFSIAPGEIVAFLGPNGAGKSTTMNMLTGYISSTSGTIKIDGCDIVNKPMEAKKRIGYLPELPPLYLDMTLDEYLDFVYDLKGATQPKKEHLQEIKELTNLSHMGGRLLRNFSKGYRQRAGLAQALVGDPAVLILDEPTIGLDPKQIVEFRNVIASLGKTTILSTHILSEASALCTRMIIISGGKLIASGSRDELEGKNEFRYTVELSYTDCDVCSVLSAVDGVLEVSALEEENTFLLTCTKDVRPALFRALAEKNIAILQLKKAAPTLEEIFMRAVSGTGEEETK
ncbi:MAG: ATP-binding cassette domain-containing protein [Clostridia bacterium]|nr:ATP-binding cassette domain-containing protein [Clostridia bacterium]